MSDEKKPVQVSKAPPPIKPISGTGSATPRATAKVPDWDFWRHMPRAEVWQVCALSLKIEPDSLERGAYGQWRGFASNEVAERFDKRIRLYSNVTNTLAHSEISLSDFAAWAVNEMKWGDLPSELVALAQQPAKPLAPESAAAPSGVPAHGKKPNPITTHFIEPYKGSIPTRFVIEVADEMEAGGRKITPATVWNELAKKVGTSIIEDTKPDAFLCNVGEIDLYPLTLGAVRGILARRKKARLTHG